MESSNLERAREFLRADRIALVGVSRNEKDFSRGLLRELARRGHDVVPVNPALAEAEGRRCFARLQDLDPPVEVAVLLTSPGKTDVVLRDCVEAGVRRVWLHRGAGPGAASPNALAFCAANGLEVVRDLCPFMALPGTQLPHRIHRFFRTRFSPRSGRASSSGRRDR